MSEENVDTTEAPAEGAEPTEPTGEESPQPEYVTADALKAAIERQAQSIQSWTGRRDKEFIGAVESLIDQRLNQEQPSSDELSSRLLENPRQFIREEARRQRQEEQEYAATHLNSTMETVGMAMEADPLYQDKELGNEVVQEIKQMVQAGKLNTNAAPAEAGRLILGDALTNVLRKRNATPTNPLAGNAPGNTGSSLQAPAGNNKKPKQKPPKLSETAQKLADKWGYSEDDLARVFSK